MVKPLSIIAAPYAPAAEYPVARLRFGDLFRPTRTEIDTAAQPSDGLVVFSVIWAMAMMLSVASHTQLLFGAGGVPIALLNWLILGIATLLIMRPRRTRLLGVVAGLMLLQYVARLPVASNNQTIAMFMNLAIIAVFAREVIRHRSLERDRELAYERLRFIARALLATMYFYGIFHKINTDFLDPTVSCATALYAPLTAPFGLDRSLIGIYAAIASTFVIESIAMVCLFWRKYFWVGLIISLPFHYVIPISGYSWYMDFSCLVFALYMLAVPREVSSGLYSAGLSLVRRLPWLRGGTSGAMALGIAIALAAAIVLTLTSVYPDRSDRLVWHSMWLLVWTAFGGVAMILITRAALLALPYAKPAAGAPQPWWVYAIPATLFLTCLSPYFGLKTESSITMFSNLHTEAGQTNHLLFQSPPYFFDYQARVARIIDSSDPELRRFAGTPIGFVEHDIALRLRRSPDQWISYTIEGQRYDRVTNASFSGHRPNLVERKLLTFKPVDFARPKVCTH